MRIAVTVDPSLAESPALDEGQGLNGLDEEGHDLRAADRRRQIDDLDIGEDEVDGTETSAFTGRHTEHGAADAARGSQNGIPGLVEVPGARRPDRAASSPSRSS